MALAGLCLIRSYVCIFHSREIVVMTKIQFNLELIFLRCKLKEEINKIEGFVPKMLIVLKNVS